MRASILHIMALAALTACGAGPSSGAEASNATQSDSAPSGRPFSMAQVAKFSTPWAMAFLPKGAPTLSNLALITEKEGKVWLLNVATGKKQPVSGVPKVLFEGQGGLLDVATSPNFARDGLVYLTYSEPSSRGGSSLALARAKLATGASSSLVGLRVLWRDPNGGEGGQFGGRIAFAPDGRSLFLSSGERQRFTPAQDRNQPLGKILHLTLNGQPAPGNPWAGELGSATVKIGRPPEDTKAAEHAVTRSVTWPGPNRTPAETWTLGHRNPYGLAFAPDGRLWETEMGPQGGDELNLILPGRNYGWPKASNGSDYGGGEIPDHRPGDGFEPPRVWWNPSVSPGGLLIYSGNLFPQWKGDALIPALSGLALIRFDLDGDKARKADQWDMDMRVRGLAQGPRGEVYLIEDGDTGGRIFRLEPKR